MSYGKKCDYFSPLVFAHLSWYIMVKQRIGWIAIKIHLIKLIVVNSLDKKNEQLTSVSHLIVD